MTISNVTAQQNALASWISGNPKQAVSQIEAQIQAETKAQAQSGAATSSPASPPVQTGSANPTALAQFAQELQAFLTNLQSTQATTSETGPAAGADTPETDASDTGPASTQTADSGSTPAAGPGSALQQMAAQLQQLLGEIDGSSTSTAAPATTPDTQAASTNTGSQNADASSGDSLHDVLDRLQQTLSQALQAYQFTNPAAFALAQVV